MSNWVGALSVIAFVGCVKPSAEPTIASGVKADPVQPSAKSGQPAPATQPTTPLAVDCGEWGCKATISNRVVTIRPVAGSGENGAVAAIEVNWEHAAAKLHLDSGFEECETLSADLSGASKVTDSRLAMVQLFCEHGEDLFRRDIVTGLLFVGDAANSPAILWHGSGSYSNDFGDCQQIDVLFFESAAPGLVLAKREKVTTLDEPEERLECKPVPRAITVEAKVTIPKPGP